MFIVHDIKNSKWVSKVKANGFDIYILTDDESKACKFKTEVEASAIIGHYFGDTIHECVVQEIKESK